MLREVKQLPWGGPTGEWLSRDSNPGLLSVKSELSLVCSGQSAHVSLPFLWALTPSRESPELSWTKTAHILLCHFLLSFSHLGVNPGYFLGSEARLVCFYLKSCWRRVKVEVKVKLLSHVRLCNPMDCSLPGSSVLRIFQARILEWVAISFSRRSSRPRDWTWVSCIVGSCFTIWAKIPSSSPCPCPTPDPGC